MQLKLKISKYFIFGLFAILAVIFADQYSKWFVMENMLKISGPSQIGFVEWISRLENITSFFEESEKFKVLSITSFLNFVMVWNQGISFGMFDNNGLDLSMVFISISLLASLLLLFWLAVVSEKSTAFALSLIIGGAIANVIDRIRLGAVIDFIDFYIGSYHWPAFNIADACIAIGAGIMIVITFIYDEEKTNEKAK